MERLKLANEKEYELAVNGLEVDEDAGMARIRIVTGETVEAVSDVFSEPEATATMKCIDAENTTLRSVEGYTERGRAFTRSEGVVIEQTIQPDTNGAEERTGTIIEFNMYRPSLAADVERNRADIDYLMMMEGETV